MNARTALEEGLLDLAWRQWSTLGVAGVDSVDSVAIDLEALLLLTAKLSPADPRLRDEALDWCAKSHRFISKPRLKQLIKLSSHQTQDAFVVFSTKLEHHVGGKWPSAVPDGRSVQAKLSGKSRAPALERSALLNLRLRAVFGVDARADVISATLDWPAPDFGASDLVFIGYTKRNLADVLDALAEGGFFASKQVGNRLRFSWRKRAELSRLLDPLPRTIPRWPPIIRVVVGFLELFEKVEGKSERLALVESVRAMNEFEADLSMLGLDALRSNHQALEWPQVVDRMLSNAKALIG